MRAPISVIIPTLNAEKQLGPCLGALYEGVEAGVIRELIVVDGGSSDKTVSCARDVGAEVLETVPSRGGQLRLGCEVAQGAWFLVVHADTVLQAGWTGPVVAHLSQDRAGYFRLRFDAEGFAPRWVAGWANLRARVLGLPYGDQGMLVPRALYDAVGGYRDMPLMEDVSLARRIGRGRMVMLGAEAMTSADKYQRQGWLRRGARNLWTLLRYFIGISPERFAAAYRR